MSPRVFAKGYGNINLADVEEEDRVAKIREEHFKRQRPPGFVSFKGDPFKGNPDALTVLDRLGYDIIDDNFM
ncbi:hypothetical protein V1514DRAFT_320821 [Lipomyces japonicus]|uniref:uncharacterized protein n=1 Tax=Lipomyces japonicus TaxID=56871 RepID=UPI0034CD1414